MFDGAEVTLKKGQFITGRKSLAKSLNTTEQKIRSRLALLEKHNQIIQKSTNKFTVITVVKYSHYQYDEKKITNREPTDNQQITTNNKVNKDNTISEANASADNSENMWNTTSDDFADEVAIDLDGDGTLEEKKPQTRKYPNAPAVRKVFQEVTGKNPKSWNHHKNQLLACENLYTERGLNAIRNALVFAHENKDKEFCPEIHSPHCLDAKWTKLGTFKQKQNGN